MFIGPCSASAALQIKVYGALGLARLPHRREGLALGGLGHQGGPWPSVLPEEKTSAGVGALTDWASEFIAKS